MMHGLAPGWPLAWPWLALGLALAGPWPGPGWPLAWPLAGLVQTSSSSNQFQFRPVPAQTGSGSDRFDSSGSSSSRSHPVKAHSRGVEKIDHY